MTDAANNAAQGSPYVLEIGSGWGGFVVYAAQHYGCRVTA